MQKVRFASLDDIQRSKITVQKALAIPGYYACLGPPHKNTKRGKFPHKNETHTLHDISYDMCMKAGGQCTQILFWAVGTEGLFLETPHIILLVLFSFGNPLGAGGYGNFT